MAIDAHRARVAKARDQLLEQRKSDHNVVGAAYGRKIVHDAYTDELGLVVYVNRKLPADQVPPAVALPGTVNVDGFDVTVDVVETGTFRAHGFTGMYRPAMPGVGIGPAGDLNTPETSHAGTLGAMVVSKAPYEGQWLCFLSNNHVIAGLNQQSFTGAYQPAVADDPTNWQNDWLGNLLRYVPLDFDSVNGSNLVDAAVGVCSQTSPPTLVNQAVDGTTMPPCPERPAVGLLFAGSSERTILNPIAPALNALNVELADHPDAIVDAEIGMHVDKVSRTTGYTTATVTELDATVLVQYALWTTGVYLARFTGQILTTPMSSGGDSGAVVCQGGAGNDAAVGGTFSGSANCQTLAAVDQTLDVPLSHDTGTMKDVRDNVLRPTEAGRYLVDLFYTNEDAIKNRIVATQATPAADAVAQAWYGKYIGSVKLAATGGRPESVAITDETISDARATVNGLGDVLSPDERGAMHALIDVAATAIGHSAAQAMQALDNHGTATRLRQAFSRISYLQQPPR